MDNSKWTNRWYDKDPTVSLAVSILRSAASDNQDLVAEFIVKRVLDYGINPPHKVESFLDMFKMRWYDENKNLSRAFEYLKEAPQNIQQEIAIEMIDYIYKLDGSLNDELP